MLARSWVTIELFGVLPFCDHFKHIQPCFDIQEVLQGTSNARLSKELEISSGNNLLSWLFYILRIK